MINLTNLTDKKEQRFRRLVFLTVIVVYLLILAGGIVRATGSGMGCPDWPKCFGRWVPPTELSQLPPNYQEVYGAKLKGEIEFNAVKTWIEYINRLLGVLSGFFILGTLVRSLIYRNKDNTIIWGSLIAFVLVLSNAWLGSRVVASELAHYIITLHLLLAIAVIFALLYVLVRTNNELLTTKPESNKGLRTLLVITIGLTFFQLIIGTQVREELDHIVKLLGYNERGEWIESLGRFFYIHRSFSIVILALHVAVVYQLYKLSTFKRFDSLAKALLGLVLVEIGTGIIMAYFNVPAWAQPVHLLLAVTIMGLQFVVWLLLNPLLINADQQNIKVQTVKA